MRRAGFWIRLVATAVDVSCALLLCIAVTFVREAAGGPHDAESVVRASALALDAMILLVTLPEAAAGATLGKRVLNLHVARVDGTPADRWTLFLRWSSKLAPTVLITVFQITRFPLFYLAGGFLQLVVLIGCLYASNDDKLAWHDQWARTAVLRGSRLRKPGVPSPTPGARQ